jgi:ribosome-associated protein
LALMSDTAPVAPENLLRVNAAVSIPRSELDIRVSRASGAGGQHVNKTSSRVEIFWNVRESTALTDTQRVGLLARLASRLTAAGSIRIVASDMRSQMRNRELAEERLVEAVAKALVTPKKRRPTRPTRAAKQARLESKKRQSRKKSNRRDTSFD